jgi:hypothetical protein
MCDVCCVCPLGHCKGTTQRWHVSMLDKADKHDKHNKHDEHAVCIPFSVCLPVYRYRTEFPCYNDDMSGSAATVLACIIAALPKIGGRLGDHVYLFSGAHACKGAHIIRKVRWCPP